MRDYEKLAKALRCCHLTSGSGCAECPRRLENNDSCYKLLPDAADAIEGLQAALPHWISVEERLPDTYEWVLVHGRESLIPAEAYFDGKTFVDGILCEIPVSHWMPLPESPEEVE